MTIAVDLDGTLAHYDHWRGIEHIGEPIKPMLDRVHKLLEQGDKVDVFTARAGTPEEIQPVIMWMRKHGLANCGITNIKRKEFTQIWDDRAIRIMRNVGYPSDQKEFMDQQDEFEPAMEDSDDQGAHYRYEYKGVKLDPARICKIYNVDDMLLGAIVKKALCAGERGHKDFKQDLLDIICAANRRLEMLEEDLK